MPFDYNVFVALNGITDGARLFLIASGLTLAFSLMRVVNLAHGAFYLIGGYVGFSIFAQTGSWLLALFTAGVAIVAMALVVKWSMLDRFSGQALPQTLVTLALQLVIADVCLTIWGGHPLSIRTPSLLKFRVPILGLPYPGFRLFVLGLAIVIGIGLWFFLNKTKLGAAIRAGVDDRETAAALGINIDYIFTFIFALSGFLAGFAGSIGGTYLSLGPGVANNALLFALIVIIIGGLGRLAGAALGALVTGLILSFARAYIPQLSFMFAFLPMIIILAIRPQGLLGKT